MHRRFAAAAVFATGLAAGPALAGSVTLDLEAYEHGRILNGLDLRGVSVAADNFHTSGDYAVVFDTRARGTDDPDLQGPNASGGRWDAGNVAADQVLGNLIILQERSHRRAWDNQANSGGVMLRPDDEGKRSGGSSPGAGALTFTFARGVSAVGFDLVDIEGHSEFGPNTGYFAAFSGGGETTTLSFAELGITDPSITWGNNSANRIAPLTAEALGLGSIESVTVNLGGSGAVGNINFTHTIPTPTAGLGGVVILTVLAIRRRRRVA